MCGSASSAARPGRRAAAYVSCAALAWLGACSPPRQISDSGFGAYEVSLAAWSDGLAVAWYDTRDGNAEIYVRRLDGNGRNAGAELRLTTTAAESYEADIVPLEGAFAVAWYEKADDESLRAQLGVWSRDGTPKWRLPIGADGRNSRNPVVRTFGDVLFCAWIEADAEDYEFVWAGWWGLDGRPRGEPVRLGAAGETTWNLNAAVAPSGAAWVVFDAEARTGVEELFVATLVDGRAALARVSADDGFPSKYPDIALQGETGALAWFDERDGNREVYLAVAPVEELLLSAEGHARRVTLTPGASIGAYVAWNRDRVGLAWSDDSSGNYEVFFQSFDTTGEPLSPYRQLSDTPESSMIPAIKPWRDGFALAWDEVELGSLLTRGREDRGEVVFTIVR